MTIGPRILVLDIETSPALMWGYGMFNQNFSLEMIERKPGIIGWASRWKDQPAKRCKWYDGPAMDGYIDDLTILWEQLNEATHVLHFNGQRFDMPWTNHEFIKYGIADGRPPSPYKQIDLMKQIKREVRSHSNKLQFLSTDLLGLEGKIGASALTLWLRMYHAAMANDTVAYEKARADMARYCKRDVNLLPPMMDKYLPWMTGINSNQYTGDPDGCPNCKAGPSALQRRGYAQLVGGGTYQRYQCQKCGTWSRGTMSVEMTRVRNYR
jgi:hypothetical protein